MKTFLFLILVFSFIFSSIFAQECVRIYGQVTDFKGNPIDSVYIRLKNKSFTNLYETLSDEDGKFSLVVKKGDYYCLYAIKLSDYKKTKLEYWAWNVPVYKDLEIKPSNTSEILKETERVAGFDKITIVLDSKETGEIGKGEAFVRITE